MRRILLTSLFGILFGFTASAIVDTVFIERFDPPSGPDSVSTYNTNSLLNSHWNDTTQLWVSSPASYHTRMVPADSVIFETNSFSTVGNTFIRLSFNHIAKVHFGQRGYIQASNDGGQTWTTLTGSMYHGGSPQFASNGYFNELSYPNPQGVTFWHGPTLNPSQVVSPANTWWAQEVFDISTILGGVNGYANCKVRFIAKHQLTAPVTLAGWYVDDVLVEAAPCELDPPTFTYDIFKKPENARYAPTEQLRVKARDAASGVDSVLLNWSVNGGTWQSIEMTALNSGSCPDSSFYQYTWTGIAVFDTIDWYIEIFDCACPNMTRDPSITSIPNHYTFWRDLSAPLICGTATSSTFPLVVSQFPWLEDFEGSEWVAGSGSGSVGTAHRGTWPTDNPPNGLNWTVTPNPVSNGFAWSIRSTGTATNFTGPNGDHTANGTNYIYTEASQGNGSPNPVNTRVTTPCLDLSNVNCAALEFYYHMYGANIDRIRVDVDTGNATSQFVNGIELIVGHQQTSGSQPYRKGFVSLEPFIGKIVRLRFLARKNTSTTADKNDIAIDDIHVFEPTSVDVEMTDYLGPENGFCSYSNAEVVTGALQNLGCQTLTAIPIACKYELNGGAPVIVRDTLGGSYPLAKDTSFAFNPTIDLSSFGTYKIWIWSEVPGDTISGNDTIGPYTILHEQAFTGNPYILDFDDAGTIAGDGTSNNPGTLSTTDWERLPNPANGGYAFHVMEQKTPSMATGPRWDYSDFTDGNYIYAEGDFGNAPVNAQFVTHCFDLGTMTNPVIDFMYHMYGSDIGNLRVQVVPIGQNTWTQIPGAIISGSQNSSSRSNWKHGSASLSTWAGQIVKLRFLARKTGSGSAADIALDNIRIYDRKPTDVGILLVKRPSTRVDTVSPFTPIFTIKNFGSSSASNIPIIYTITPSCGPNAGVPTTYNYTYTGNVAAGAEQDVTIPANQMPIYPGGTFMLCAKTNLTGDNNSFNDEYCRKTVGWTQAPIQTGFSENFDPCNDGVESGFWYNGDYWAFQHGSKEFSSAPYAYSSYEFGWNSYSGTEEYLNAPRFIGFDTIVGAQLWFKHKFQFGTADVGLVEYYLNNAWNPLGFQDPDDNIGINWYNAANINSINNGSGFTGSSSTWAGNTNGWITRMWPLNIFNKSPNPLSLRWRLVSSGGGTVGWAVDDVEVRIPPQNSAAPIEIDTKEFPRFPNIPATVQLRIQNTGAKRLDSCLASFKVDGGPWSPPEKFVFNPGLNTEKKTALLDFTNKWQNPTSGSHNVCVATWGPNSKLDNFTPDDTICTTLKVLDEFVFTATDTQYCITFDDPAQVDWIESNTYNKAGLVSWEKGTPAQAPIIGAHSAPNAWMTKLNNNYKVRDSSSLYSTVFKTDSGGVYEISFWHNFKTELYHDGGTVDISFDGLSWRTVGYVIPQQNGTFPWFNIEHVTSLNIIDPGWSGESGGWIESHIKVQFDQPRKSVLRFRFGSDQSFEYQGWAIDDFCMTASSGIPNDFISIDELNNSSFIDIGNVIPNPSNGETRIPYYLAHGEEVNMTVYNSLGQQMLNINQQSEHGVNMIHFDVTGWTPGLYVIAIDVHGERVTRKMMVR